MASYSSARLVPNGLMTKTASPTLTSWRPNALIGGKEGGYPKGANSSTIVRDMSRSLQTTISVLIRSKTKVT